MLFGKPQLQRFGAVPDYTQDTLHIPHNDGSWVTLPNEYGETRTSAEISRGVEIPPLRQVQPTSHTCEPVNKQTSFTSYVPVEERMQHNVVRHGVNVASGLGLSWRHELRGTVYEDELSKWMNV